MKTKKWFVLVGIMMISTAMFAQNKKTEQIKVYGKCGMCETRIEKAASQVPGVLKADWNRKTMELTVKYKTKKTNSDLIQKAVAKVGHDTDKYKADDKVYNALPACCKYREK